MNGKMHTLYQTLPVFLFHVAQQPVLIFNTGDKSHQL
jgi:hypothetical protein